ncbi:autotransporter domain-containing protein [Aquabacter spiritensis]|uniref:Outer membrane autotransporter protein n=1 Tax=Aquabacter spiritensis TaxID=933073 RepID=A0A4R3M273_9HYPH|nr:autotransporter domain-containing protein [Aquabacter spiritensis]TCT05225.1 outer membrane autotransporter protein [Aquabacter spiritensis]
MTVFALAAGVSLAGLVAARPALAQASFCKTDACVAAQVANQIAVTSTFGTLLQSAEGLALLQRSAAVTTQIYATSTAAQRATAAENAVNVPGKPLGSITAHLWHMADTPISAQMVTWALDETMPGTILADLWGTTGTVRSGAVKDYYQTLDIYKTAYHATDAIVGNPRPFVALPAIGDHPWTTATTPDAAVAIQQEEWSENVGESAFASGHSMRGFITGMYYGMLLPTYWQDMFASAQQYGLSRNILGMHYALDVIGGRIVALETLTQLMRDDPNYASGYTAAFEANRLALTAALGGSAVTPVYAACGANLTACLASGAVPSAATYRAARDQSTWYLTYGLPAVGDTTRAPVVPENAELLFRTRFPYLSDAQIRDVIASTELPSGVPLDNGSGWARINPYAAAGGYGAFAETVTVTMDAAKGGLNAFDIWSNDIRGAGGLIKHGTGTLLLAGDNSYAGETSVQGGTLALTGSLAGNVTIGRAGAFVSTGSVGGALTNSGSLSGTGRIGGTLTNAGLLQPGFSIGTLTVGGNLNLTAGSVYVAETGSAGASDQIVVTGATGLDGALVLVAEDGGPSALGTYTVITSAGGVSGAFSSVQTGGPFLTGSVAVAGTQVRASVAPNVAAFATAGGTPNANAAGLAVAFMPYASPVLQSAVTLTAAGAPAALASLTGEIHAATGSVLAAQSTYLRQTLTNRLGEAEGGATAALAPLSYAAAPAAPAAKIGGFTAWGQGYGGWGSVSGGAASAVTSSVGGFLGGFDSEVAPGWRVGLAGGYSQTAFSTDAVSGSGDSDNYDLALYGANRMGPVTLRYAASYTWHDISTSRGVALPNLYQSLSADQDGGTGQVFGEVAYGVKAPGGVLLEPFAGLAYVRLDLDGFTETGGSAALTSGGLTQDNVLTTLGARVSQDFTAGTAMLAIRGSLAWQHAFGDLDPGITERFAVSGGPAFSVTGAPVARDTALLGLGLDWLITANARLGVSYTGQLAAETQNNAVQGRLTVAF